LTRNTGRCPVPLGDLKIDVSYKGNVDTSACVGTDPGGSHMGQPMDPKKELRRGAEIQ